MYILPVTDLEKICWGCQKCMYYILNGFKLKSGQVVGFAESQATFPLRPSEICC